MGLTRTLCLACCLVLLQDNADGSKSSVQTKADPP